MIAKLDLSDAAADALLSRSFDQTQGRERDLSMSKVAQSIGRAMGMPKLR